MSRAPNLVVTEDVVKLLTDLGFRRVSNRFGIISRINRPDWKEHMAIKHAPWNHEQGHSWVNSLLKSNLAQDHYRRCCEDGTLWLELGKHRSSGFKPSGWDPVEFVELTPELLDRINKAGLDVVLSKIYGK